MNSDNFLAFKNLHNHSKPLILSNIWDAASAAIVQVNGASAIATSSAAVAWSLGYADGSQLPIDELMACVKRIMRTINLPLTVDIENGYSDDKKQVSELAYQLTELGVVGINIEDGVASSERLIEKIETIKAEVGKGLFINARTDIYLQDLVEDNLKVTKTVERLKQYAIAGADGGFIPGLSKRIDIQEILSQLDMPINLMISGCPDEIEQFSDMGVKRLSLGPAPFIHAYSTLIRSGKPSSLDYSSLNDLF